MNVLSFLDLSGSGTEIRIGRYSQCKLCDFSRKRKICFLCEQHKNMYYPENVGKKKKVVERYTFAYHYSTEEVILEKAVH